MKQVMGEWSSAVASVVFMEHLWRKSVLISVKGTRLTANRLITR